MSKILVTSALPYANGDIHIGHLVEYIQTDIWVRFLRLIGKDVVYVCASDAHGTPIEINARKRGLTPEDLVAYHHRRHQDDFALFQVDFDEFYTTDSPENRAHSETIYLRAKEKGHVDVRDIEQHYCEHCGRFLPDRYIKGSCPRCGAADQYGDVCESCGATYSPTELSEAYCAICGARPSLRSSTHFFFRLKDFQEFLVEWTAHPGRLQEDVLAFVRGWIDQGLHDWDISRDGPYFGFKIPGEENKFFYVWLDAPVGYIAATEHYCARITDRSVHDYWTTPDAAAEIHHFIGKDIAYFHTLFWPAMLKAAQYKLPDAVHVHGFLTVDGKKMSKSRGTFINAATFAQFIEPGYLRYYYAAKLGNSTVDLDLNTEEFVTRVNAELVNNITNLISRTVGFLNKRLDSRLGTVPEDEETKSLIKEIESLVDSVETDYRGLRFGSATQHILAMSTLINGYIQTRAPWDLMKAERTREEARNVLTFAVNAIKVLTVLLKPIIPAYCKKVETMLGVGELAWPDARLSTRYLENHTVGTFEKLADRLEAKTIDALLEASRQSLGVAEKDSPASQIPEFKSEISIEQLMEVDLRVGRIEKAEQVKGSDKLLKLTVNLGRETRTIFAGIARTYEPGMLEGKNAAVAANLKPRKMRFGMSEGMVLAGVGPDGELAICELDPSLAPGSPIQ